MRPERWLRRGLTPSGTDMKAFLVICLALAGAAMLGCAAPASQKAAERGEAASAAKPRWDVATEAEVASAIDRKVAEFARDYVQLKKDGVLMFCKRYKQVGSNLPTITCLTEAQLRTLAENTAEYRDRRRSAARCPHGPQGCSGQ